ncbi:MAG: serine protein kinase RIO [Candidatus Micrarchaeia archaeon]|jgi:RIO kinase 1
MKQWKRKQPKREDKQMKQRGKITAIVLDDSTIDELVHFINTGQVKSIDYPISQGKEAFVFRATAGPKAAIPEGGERYIAAKVYKYETSSFQKMAKYIDGDNRFSHVKRQLRPLVQQWARKEYANLQACHAARVSVPKPLAYRKNVVLMEFLGEGGVPAALLKDIVLDDPENTYREVLENMKKMHQKAKLVHADLSEFNIIIYKGKPVFIDVSQSVLLDHPMAGEFLKKDVENIVKYFQNEGVQGATFEKAHEFVTGKKPAKTSA